MEQVQYDRAYIFAYSMRKVMTGNAFGEFYPLPLSLPLSLPLLEDTCISQDD